MENIQLFLDVYRFVFIIYTMTLIVYHFSNKLNPLKDFKSIKLDAILAITLFIFSFFYKTIQ